MRVLEEASFDYYNEDNIMHRLTHYSSILPEGRPLDMTIENQATQESWSSFLFQPIFLASVLTGAILVTKLVHSAFVARCKRKKGADRKKKSIHFYLRNFKVEDIVLRRAPTGGYHATYSNNLASGFIGVESLTKTDSNSTSTENTVIDECDDDPPIIIDLDVEAGAEGRQKCKINRVENVQRTYFPRRSDPGNLFTDPTSSTPYLGERNRDNDNADGVGLTPKAVRDAKHDWRAMEDETI